MNLTDREIVAAILDRDESITRDFLYCKCFPLFKSIFDKYYTGCETCQEFINEVYIYIMRPRKNTGVSKLESFCFRCSLILWLKIVTEHFCQQLYARRPSVQTTYIDDNSISHSGEFAEEDSIDSIDKTDLHRILSQMPGQRYRILIEKRYVEDKTNEETAHYLGVSMANYYNMHKRAKEQLTKILRKEGLI